MVELELKFSIDEKQLDSLSKALRGHGARTIRMNAQYYDTADFQLARHGLSLRLRKEGRGWTQTLKAEGIHAIARLEHNVEAEAAPGTSPELILVRHDGTPAGDALRQALSGSHNVRLTPSHRTEIARQRCELELPNGTVEVALDIGTVRAGPRKAPLCELELEFKTGSTAALFDLAESWVRHGGLWLDTTSKSQRGVLLANGPADRSPAQGQTLQLHPRLDGRQMLCAVLGSVMNDLLPHASHIASGSHDAEHIHQLRVGLRRLRTALREFRSLAKDVDPGWDADLKRVFAELGRVRDDDVLAETVKPVLMRAGASKLEWRKSACAGDATDAVRDQGFQLTLLDVLKYSLSDADSRQAPARSHRAGLRHLEKRLTRLHRQAVHSGKRFAKLPLRKQHQARKRLKRLRYLAEFVAPLGSTSAVKKYLGVLRSAQDALGLHNDIGVAARHFRADGGRGSESHRSADILDQHTRSTGRSAQVALRRLSDASPFWGG